MFDILNSQHEHELGTFTFSPIFNSRLLRSLLALGRFCKANISVLALTFFYFLFLHKLTVTSRNHCIPDATFFYTDSPDVSSAQRNVGSARLVHLMRPSINHHQIIFYGCFPMVAKTFILS